jgi:hypothetical protein
MTERGFGLPRFVRNGKVAAHALCMDYMNNESLMYCSLMNDKRVLDCRADFVSSQ